MNAGEGAAVFVFGTLKEGFPNFATNRGERLPGAFTTRACHPLHLVGDRHVPWMLDRPGEGHCVAGELYRVDAAVIEAMDRLERVGEPDGYRRVEIEVVDEAGRVRSAFAYLKPSGQLAAGEDRGGPFPEYTPEHAALYRPRPRAPEPVLVSACLLGDPVRHNGQHKKSHHPALQRWIDEGRVVRVCPELAGGLPVPRPAAEIEGGAGGRAVLLGKARVVSKEGNDVTAPFVRGAEAALALVERHGIRVAVLKARSPSCGSSESYDGTFGGGLVDEPGVTGALLMSHGILVFSEEELEAADEALRAPS